MASQIRYAGVALSAVIGLVLVSCGSDSGNPVAPTGPSVSTAAIQRIEVSGPDSIAPGESAQLTATAFRSDGSSDNVTTTVGWTTSSSRSIQVFAGGRATAGVAGEATVSARIQNRVGTKVVLAIPPGTYKLSGRITEGALPVSGVSVSVTRGTGTGLTALSNTDGRFALYGVAGDVRIQASREGYVDSIRDLTVGSTMTDNFEIAPSRQRKDLTGTYSLTFDASACAGTSTYPNDLRTRRYTAAVTQAGRALTVTLSGADFLQSGSRGNTFSGSIDPAENVSFGIGNAYYYYYFSEASFDVIERLDDSRSLTFIGAVTAKVNGSAITGTLNGAFVILRGSRLPFTSTISSCYSASHTFVMQPQ